jgi:hypothetical protein
MNPSAIFNFFEAINPYKEDNVHQKDFVNNSGLLIIKNYLPIQFIENVWLKCLVKMFGNVIMLSCCFPFLKKNSLGWLIFFFLSWQDIMKKGFMLTLMLI